MTDSQPEAGEHTASVPLAPVPGALSLLQDDAVGYCTGGVCHIPAQK